MMRKTKRNPPRAIIVDRDDRQNMERFNRAFPVDSNTKTWCRSRLNMHIDCSRQKHHTGPHRRLSGMSLHFWYDEGHEREEQLLEVCVRLGVVPEDITKL